MRIFLVRHGESVGNLNGQAYRLFGDHNVPLTQFGHRQALDAGSSIAAYLGTLPRAALQRVKIWYSPYLRTRQTKDALLDVLPIGVVGAVHEDYLLREQDFGLFTEIYDQAERKEKFPDEFEKWARLRNNNGKFYARPPDGESRADVAQRVRLFLQTVMHDTETGSDDVVIVGHGVTNRAFEMNFLHHSVEWFERSDNPGNADVTLIEGTHSQGYRSSLLHRGGDRQAGQEMELRDAYGAEMKIAPKPPSEHSEHAP